MFGGEAVTFENDKEFDAEQTLALRENRTRVLTPGVARGPPLGVPAWHGARFGHIDEQFTLPVGAEVEGDAEAGTIRMLAPAVS